MNEESTLRRLRALPAPAPIDDDVSHDVQRSIEYLLSDEAFASLEADSYWPKWHSPWWHMLLMYERGEAALIPRGAVGTLVLALDRLPLKIFPIRPSDTPEGVDPSTGSSCHCALGCIVVVLIACGVDVDSALPWARDWFSRYQMADGGLNCDGDAYLAQGEVPSSMVGTIAPMEAVLALSAIRPRPEDEAFLERAAGFLVQRGLCRGSSTMHNADERVSAADWGAPTFPRFYFYDVLRGLAALVAWAHSRRRSIPWSAIGSVVDGLVERFPDGNIAVARRAFEGHMTRVRAADGTWTKREPASTFPLLAASGRAGEVSAPLTHQWWVTSKRLVELADAGLLDDG